MSRSVIIKRSGYEALRRPSHRGQPTIQGAALLLAHGAAGVILTTSSKMYECNLPNCAASRKCAGAKLRGKRKGQEFPKRQKEKFCLFGTSCPFYFLFRITILQPWSSRPF